jgi:lipopolysaccharide export system protein LptA
MRTTAERLRVLIVVISGLLILALAGFYGYARWQRRHFIKDLPARLGLSIQQSGDGYTVSSSVKDHTQYTIHAAKFVQFKGGGRMALHNVSITLYGPKDSGRSDHIYGSDFEYDPQSGTASAQGEVQIDLAGPGPATDSAKEGSADGDASQVDKRTIHVKTSGVTFNKNTGFATTDQYVEFHFSKAAGSAVGASFDSKAGLLALKSKVQLTSSTNGQPLVVRAANAQVLRDSRQAFLLKPITDFQKERSSADEAVVNFRADGSAEAIDAKGHVHLASETGANLDAGQAHIDLDDTSHPKQAEMNGGVLFISQDPVHHLHGNSQSATLTFDDDSNLKHAQLRTAVSFVDEMQAGVGDSLGTATRQVRASKVDIDLLAGPDHKSLPSKLLAQGEASVLLRSIPSPGAEQSTAISADLLLATLVNGNSVTSLHGSGNTKIVDMAQNGSTNTSTGDVLDVTFSESQTHPTGGPASLRKSKSAKHEGIGATPSNANQVESAVQQGHVALEQTPAKQQAGETAVHATADRADYRAPDQVLRLTGSPRLNNGQLDVSAGSIEYHRDTGDAAATGTVKATYLEKTAAKPVTLGGQGSVHIVADEADLNHASGDTVFRGHARIWQGANSVAAPVIELSRARMTLSAHGADKSSGAAVSATFATALGQNHQPGVARIRSQALFYSDAERKGDFHGAVVADDSTGKIQADQAEVILAPAPPAGSKGGQSPLDRMVASGHVILTQPDRHAEGTKLVYTESNGVYGLTGTGSTPPKLTDRQHGTVTGSSLTFNSRDDSVSVSGGQQSSVTQTRAPK